MTRPELSESSDVTPDITPDQATDQATDQASDRSHQPIFKSVIPPLFISALLGVHMMASVESMMSGAPLLVTLGLWLMLSPVVMALAALMTWIAHVTSSALRSACSSVGARYVSATVITGVSLVSGLTVGIERVHLAALDHIKDAAVIAPILSALMIIGVMLSIPFAYLLIPRVHYVLKRTSTAVITPLTITCVVLATGLAVMSPVALLHKAELTGPIALFSGSALIAATCLRGQIRLSTRLITLTLIAHIILIAQGITSYESDERAQRALEAGGGVAPRVVWIAQRLSDQDRDGFGVWLGGRDCDDQAPHINPDALEIPDNGVDEDCDGVDQKQVPDTSQKQVPKQVPDTSQKQVPDTQKHTQKQVPDTSHTSQKQVPDTQKQVPDTQKQVPDTSQKQVPDTSQKQDFNLLLITIDALRADHVSYARINTNGERDLVTPELTPHLDRLARSGLIFRHAYAPAASTRYSVPSLLMGASLSEVKLGWRGRYLQLGELGELSDGFNMTELSTAELNPRTHTPHLQRNTAETLLRDSLFQRLKRGGYQTAVYTGELLINGMWYGLERGVDRYVGLKRAQLRVRSSREITRAGVAQLSEWCRARGSTQRAPWALWLHYLDPHEPYLKHAEHSYGSSARERYQAEIASTDAQIGALLSALERCSPQRHTIIAVTADHGEEFGEHGKRFHGKQLYDESVRVPLLIHVPGVARVEVDEPRSAADMVETVVELLGLPPASEERRRSRSHARRLTDALHGAPPRRPFFIYRLHNERPRLLSLAIIDAPYKLIFNIRSGRAELYHLGRDPRERDELSATEPERYRDLKRRARAEARRFRQHIHRELKARHVTRALPSHLRATLSQPLELTPALTLLATELRARAVGSQTLREVSAWIRVNARPQNQPHLSVRWSDTRGDGAIERPLVALAGLYPHTRWRVGDVIELISAERIPERSASRVELIVKRRGARPREILLNGRDQDERR